MIGQWTYQWLVKNGFVVNFFESTTSTNTLAKDAAMLEKAPTVFYITEEQTAGRGQGHHRWLSGPAGENLLLTCSMDTKLPPQPELCLELGERLKAACVTVWPQLQWTIKPPNDLLLADKKVAGLLLESVSQGSQHRLILGLGFNVLSTPIDPSFVATSLKDHLTEELPQSDWNRFLDELFRRVIN